MQLQEQINWQTNWSTKSQRRIASDKILYWLGCSAVDLFAKSMLKMDVSWQAPLPSGPVIFAANHPTTLDPFLLLTLVPEETSILVTGGAFTVPLFGRYLRRVGHVPVVQGNGRAALEEAKQLLGTGRSIGIFPEGALSPAEGGFHRPRSGTARLALSSGAPIIPVGIHPPWDRVRSIPAKIDGEQAVGRFFLRGRYIMSVGAPMWLEGDAEDRENVRAVSDRIMQRITWLSQQSASRAEAAQTLIPTPEPGVAELPAPAGNGTLWSNWMSRQPGKASTPGVPS